MVKGFDNVEISKLKKFYTFRGEDVVSFLFDHPYLVDLLFEAREPLREVFPKGDFVLYMEPYFEKLLVLRVYNTGLSLDEDERRIFRLDDIWWNKNLYKARENLCITA